MTASNNGCDYEDEDGQEPLPCLPIKTMAELDAMEIALLNGIGKDRLVS